MTSSIISYFIPKYKKDMDSIKIILSNCKRWNNETVAGNDCVVQIRNFTPFEQSSISSMLFNKIYKKCDYFN